MKLREDETVTTAVAAFATWLEGWLPADYGDRIATYRHDLDFRRGYQAAAFDAGWLVPEWEPGLGGHGLDRRAALAVRAAGARRRVPKVPSVQSVGVAVPAIRQFGTTEQQDRLLLPALRGDEDWCLGMSETEAGSDLASLTTTAELHGSDYVVNGAKIWTTQAEDSRWCLLFCRTDPDRAARHRGISCLLIEMDTPGIEVRSIRVSDPRFDPFCEVIFDHVRVPADAVLGEVGGGWKVAMGSLAFERDMIWVMNSVEIHRGLATAARRARGQADASEAQVEIGQLAADALALEMAGHRGIAEERDSGAADLTHILKLLGSESLQATMDLVASLGGLAAFQERGYGDGLLLDDLEARAATIYGGTSEIHRNIIAERVLGLPR